MEKKKYKIELTRLSIALWSLVFVVLIVWSFILGLLIGGGFFSEEEESSSHIEAKQHVSMNDLSMNKNKDEKNNKNNKLPKFSFHQALTSPKSGFENRCYAVQVAAFLREKDAINLTKKLKKYGAYYVKKIKGNKTYYRVRCGHFSDKKEAEAFKKELLKDIHLKGMIVRCR